MGRSKHSGDQAEEYKTGSLQKAAKQIEEDKIKKEKELKRIRKEMGYEERKTYVEEYRKTRKTKEGSPKALFGGSISHKKALKAAKKKK